MRKHLRLIGDLARAWGVGLAQVRPWKMIVSLVLASSVALAGAISVEVGGFQYLKGLVLTAPSGTALTITDGACLRLAPDLFVASYGGSVLRPSASCGGPSNATIQTGTLSVAGTATAATLIGSSTSTNALTVGAATTGPGRSFTLSEASNNTPTAFTTVHTVIGRATASGAGSGALFFQYNSSTDQALIGALSPAVAWRDLRLAAATVSVQDAAGVAQLTITNATGALSTNGSISTTATTTKGTITLSSGTGTATVLSGAVCVCTDTTSNVSVKCAVATTTLTATGTGSDVIAYICL